ncbi:hypothetical protein PMI01_05255 [Caulobacter sp. AP07]|uniref:hypothetical protein n=1 Tax=Caulobacter sp. AP07 TaxID=1144304 RepID=UPI00027220F8|nr:hypothetical protein [Caulobacter sp. AP07]EJL21322.1 hypothetical protein PMI01_05255 [Caulobacter sp. AP07]
MISSGSDADRPDAGQDQEAWTWDHDDWDDDWAREATGEDIVHPVVPDDRPFFAPLYGLGHLLWISAVLGLLVLTGHAVHYALLLAMLGSSGALMAADKTCGPSPVRWAAWLIVFFGAYRLLALKDPSPPWWITPGVITVIVACAYGLVRRGQVRLKREVRQAPLDLA